MARIVFKACPRVPRAVCLLALAVAGFHAASYTFLLPAPRTTARIARAAYESGKVNLGLDPSSGRANSVPAPLLEVNDATNMAIMDCLEDGCSVEALMALDEKLARDEKKIQDSMVELKEIQKTSFSPDNLEALAWFDNFLSRTGSLRAQLQAMKGVESSDFVKQIVKAASVAFGGGRPNDYPKVGVSPYSA
mmetsp:Transcript_120628/g.336605  ORF Transcript_120628/g.336605 Transcript_120628/m.336605 type:complete len:192 (-) Transcript_120628:276-851(-)